VVNHTPDANTLPEVSIGQARRVSAWWWLVAGCAVALVVAGIATAIWWAQSREQRTTTYRVLGDLAGIRLELGAADVEIDGGGGAVEVRRVDDFAFGHPADERRSVSAGRLTIVSRCPRQVLGSCRVSYRVTVPDNVPVQVVTSSGAVRLTGVRASVQVQTDSGGVAAGGFCGFSLRAISEAGNVSAAADCSTERLELRSRSGDVRAVVPTGRYRVDAESDAGRRRVRGVTEDEDAPYQVQALSTTGDVTVEGA
jgi:putative adhesin